jgi:hypothetical protein
MYMVLIFDGDEGGAHNTWDYLHVTDRDGREARGVVADSDEARPRTPVEQPTSEAPARADRSGPTRWLLILGIGACGLLSGAALERARIRRRA